MQKILSNIIQGFLFAKLIDKKNSQAIINKILLDNKEEIISELNLVDNIEFNIDQHLTYIEELRQYFQNKNNDSLVENKINETLGYFIPQQPKINTTFINSDKYEKLLTLSIISYYIKTDKNRLNSMWNHDTNYGEIKISINNAKPEKTQAQIINEKNFVSENKDEPKCPICVENIDFKGSLVKDSRENLRAIFITLNEENKNEWFFQYSPYAYINKHFVLNNIKHTPMVIDNDTIRNLITFISENNNFFLGSNADLPIVGGSLLGHNHYQGGEDTLPIMNAKTLKSLKFKDANIDILNWPLNAIKISSDNSEKIIDIVNYFINEWKSNSDYGLKSINNSTTIITNKIDHNFNVYLIFRNNSKSAEKPLGNFHVDPSKFHIKQENIGLMEAGGLAILPKRLISEVKEILEIFDENNLDIILNNERIAKHYFWIKKLIKNKIKINQQNLLKDMSDIFLSCLEDCKVLNDENFIEFIQSKIKYNQEIFTIKNNAGLSIEVINKGFTIKQISLHNNPFLLEYQDVNSYFVNNDIFLNSFVGPVAGRIEKGLIKLNDKEINLNTDENNNYIHGMKEKWSDIVFDISIKSFENFDVITGVASQYNVELDCHFDIDIKLKVCHNENLINFDYMIKVDKETICNPTHHFYWKIPNNKNIWDLNINLHAKSYWKLNNNFNPEKKELLVISDFLRIMDIKDKIGTQQTTLVNDGIDHPIELDNNSEIILSSSDFQNTLIANSTLKNIVMYTQNWKSKNPLLDADKDTQQALCLEYQEIPTSISNPNFNKIIINKNKPYIQSATYKFEIK